jgi:Na+-translocating ferredoxin:NAD+ oxidoreductase RnfC subunit
MAATIQEQVRAAGVVGAGGAGFPTHVKLQARVQHVIANGAECEPLLKADQQLLLAEADALIAGLRAAMQATGALRGTIAVKHKNADAITILERRAGAEGIAVHALDDVYPAGDEQTLTYEVTGRVVPEGGLPLDVGVLVQNVETLINVAYALAGRPVTHTWVTIGGHVRRPVTLSLPVGMSIGAALQEAGGPTLADFVVLDGGPMMGRAVTDLTEPVLKTTKGLIVVPADHYGTHELRQSLDSIVRRARAACCNCTYCTEICPRAMLGHRLQPHLLMRTLTYGLQDDTEYANQAFLCCECGLCTGAFACVMDLSPRQIYRRLKLLLAEKGVANPYREAPERPHPAYEGRRVPMQRLLARLQVHTGAPAEAVVRVGDTVRAGQVIGEIEDGKLGARVHASIAGRVAAVDGHIVIEG